MTRPSQHRPWAFARSVSAFAAVVAASGAALTATAETPVRPEPARPDATDRGSIESRSVDPSAVDPSAAHPPAADPSAVDAPTSSGSSDAVQTSACIDAHVQGQEVRLEGRLLEARTALSICSSADCPRLVREDCLRLSQLVASEIPRLVLRAPAELDPTKLRTSIDGVHLKATAYDSPLPLDPGTHRLLVEAEGYLPLQTTFTLTTGAPPQTLHVTLTPSPSIGRANHAPMREPRATTHSPPAATTGREVPTLSYVFGGAALLAAGFATHFTLTGVDERARLKRTCAPLCHKRDVASLEQQFLLADVSAGVSVVSLALAAVLYFVQAPDETEVAVASDMELELASAPLALQLGGRF